MQSNNVVQFPWQLTCQTVFQQALQAEGLVAASLEEYSAPFSQADFNHLSHTIQSPDQSSILYSTLQKFAQNPSSIILLQCGKKKKSTQENKRKLQEDISNNHQTMSFRQTLPEITKPRGGHHKLSSHVELQLPGKHKQ
jgi:hypothetical protein